VVGEHSRYSFLLSLLSLLSPSEDPAAVENQSSKTRVAPTQPL